MIGFRNNCGGLRLCESTSRDGGLLFYSEKRMGRGLGGQVIALGLTIPVPVTRNSRYMARAILISGGQFWAIEFLTNWHILC